MGWKTPDGKVNICGLLGSWKLLIRFTYQPWNLPLRLLRNLHGDGILHPSYFYLCKTHKPRVQSPLPCKNCCSLVLIKGQICFCRGRSALLFQCASVNPDLWFLSTKALQVGGWGPAKARFICFRLTCVQSRPSVSFFSPWGSWVLCCLEPIMSAFALNFTF